jgi:short-subunit dehydrogenase
VALVTGASAGIGAAFAEALAARGLDLVLVARSADALAELGHGLAERFGVRVRCIPTDLADSVAVAGLIEAVSDAGLAVELLINNAGFASHGPLQQIDPGLDHAQAMVNAVAVVDLCHAFLPGMVERDRGAVINVSSLGGFQPAPYLAVYAATKAFTLSFSQSLAGELAGTGVRVQALCPGPVTTGFFDDLGTTEGAVGQTLTAKQVVARSLRALERDRPVVVPGWRNAIAAQANRFLPRRLITAVAKRAVGPGQHAQQAARPSVDERRSG